MLGTQILHPKPMHGSNKKHAFHCYLLLTLYSQLKIILFLSPMTVPCTAKFGFNISQFMWSCLRYSKSELWNLQFNIDHSRFWSSWEVKEMALGQQHAASRASETERKKFPFQLPQEENSDSHTYKTKSDTTGSQQMKLTWSHNLWSVISPNQRECSTYFLKVCCSIKTTTLQDPPSAEAGVSF